MKKSKKEKKTKQNIDAKALFSNEDYGNGLRCVIICILAVILVVGVNLFVSVLPTALTNVDISTEKVHSISEDTKEQVRALSQPVEVYLVCEEGEENDNTRLILNLYADQSDYLTVTQVDPAFSPQLVAQYTGDTAVDNNSIIVVSGERQQVLAYSDYYSGTSFVLEDYMNSALDFVTSDSLEKIYTLTGHGETDLSDSIQAYLGLDGFQAESLQLLEKGSVPTDAGAVVVNGPTKDISEKEADILLSYLENGGKLLLVTGYTDQSLTNLETVTAYFGASLEKGIVAESDENHYVEDNPANILPYVLTSGNETLTDGVAYVLMPSAKGIKIDEDLRDSVESSVVLMTGDTAYSLYTNIFTNSQETIEGPFNLGVTFKETVGDGEARMIWFSSKYISDESISAYVGGGNLTMFLSSISWVAEDDPVPSIHGKTISTQFLTVDTSSLNVWKILLIGVIPLAVLAAGVTIYIRRKRK